MDELLSRQKPHSAEAEQSVLGSMLIDPRCIPVVIGALKPDDFYVKANRDIYETIYGMFSFSEIIDPVTVLEKMRQNGVFHEDVSTTYIFELMNITPTAANVREYASIVADKSLLRQIDDMAGEVSQMVAENTGTASEILEAAEKRIYSLRQGSTATGLEDINTVMNSTFTELRERAKNAGEVPGLSTGFRQLDQKILGLNKSDLLFIASRPGMGKTSFALNIALNVAKSSGKPVAIFSLEMSKEQLALRLLSGEAYISSAKLMTGRVKAEEWTDLLTACEAIKHTKILINDNPSLTVAEMNAQCRRVNDLGLVVIDYLQLMQGSGYGRSSNENRTQIVSDISRMLKIMAKELNVPVVCMSQLNRSNEQSSNKRPALSALRESGSIEQDADVVLGLYREDYYNNADAEGSSLSINSEAECIIMKNRHGETGKVMLMWMGEFTSFAEIDYAHRA